MSDLMYDDDNNNKTHLTAICHDKPDKPVPEYHHFTVSRMMEVVVTTGAELYGHAKLRSNRHDTIRYDTIWYVTVTSGYDTDILTCAQTDMKPA